MRLVRWLAPSVLHTPLLNWVAPHPAPRPPAPQLTSHEARDCHEVREEYVLSSSRRGARCCIAPPTVSCHAPCTYLHPTLRQPTAAATHAPSAHRARDASACAACRGPALRRKRTGALSWGGWWSEGCACMRSQRHLAATELTRACTCFLCLRRLSCCTRLRGAFRTRPAALRVPARMRSSLPAPPRLHLAWPLAASHRAVLAR